MEREEEIRVIAYSIWEQEGYVDGQDVEHWLRAEAIWEEKRGNVSPEKSVTSLKKPPAKARAKRAVTARKRA